jgi:phosphate/sulfate permease
MKKEKPVESVDAERIYVLFSFLQTMTATFASFVHGGNDVRYATIGLCKILLCVDNNAIRSRHWGRDLITVPLEHIVKAIHACFVMSCDTTLVTVLTVL